MRISKEKISELKKLKEQTPNFNVFEYLDSYSIVSSTTEFASNNIQKLKDSNLLDENSKLSISYIEDLQKRAVRNAFGSRSLLRACMQNSNVFSQLYANNLIDDSFFKSMHSCLDTEELAALCEDNFLFSKCLENKVFTFQEILDLYTSKEFSRRQSFNRLLTNVEYKKLLNQNLIELADIQSLFEKIKTKEQLKKLCRSEDLVEISLSNFLFTDSSLASLNKITKSAGAYKDVFEAIHYEVQFIDLERIPLGQERVSQQLQVLNELTKNIYRLASNFNADEKMKILELARNNEVAKNRLIQIVENHLESNYDFDSLMSYLKKTEKKNLINI